MIGFVFVCLAVASTACGIVSYKLYCKVETALILFTTIVLMMLAPVFNFLALQQLSVDEVYMATSFNNLIVLSLSYYVLGERVNKRQFIGAALVFTGVIIYLV